MKLLIISKRKIQEVLPDQIFRSLKISFRWIYSFLYKIKFLKISISHLFVLRKVRKKIKRNERIKVAFFLIHESVWKYDEIYKLFENDKRFDPSIVVCPYVLFGNEVMFTQMRSCANYFISKGFNVHSTFSEKKQEWIDIKKEINPDIIFFTNPYKVTKKMYYITNFLNVLTCYVPYGYMITERPEMQYNQQLHNWVFRFYIESRFHLNQVKIHSYRGGKNVVVTGYSGLDKLLYTNRSEVFSNPWKKQSKQKKRIIWAPHHTIELVNDKFNYSNFLSFYQLMLNLANELQNEIQFCFKPHPILKTKLYNLVEWGKIRTDDYFARWEELPNGQLVEGDYTGLFLTSDALIHDSGSFIVEYLCVDKPILYQIRDKEILNGFNKLGNEAIDCAYKAYTWNDLLEFINEVVINDTDQLKELRKNFIQKYLIQSNGSTASRNIYNDLMSRLSLIK